MEAKSDKTALCHSCAHRHSSDGDYTCHVCNGADHYSVNRKHSIPCENCKHFKLLAIVEPCASCDIISRSKWELDLPVKETKTKNFTNEEVVTLIVDAVMIAMGDEWVAQEDDEFKQFLKRNNLLEVFEKEYDF